MKINPFLVPHNYPISTFASELNTHNLFLPPRNTKPYLYSISKNNLPLTQR